MMRFLKNRRIIDTVDFARQLCPPLLWAGLVRMKNIARKQLYSHSQPPGSELLLTSGQDLSVYWTSEMADALETWGEGTVWQEILYLMVNCKGRVLDVCCGTGKTMALLGRFPDLSLYGCDISAFLIGKAMDRGVRPEKLVICDATQLVFAADSFNFAYSIGSLEHFTEDGILKHLSECSRVVKNDFFFMVPVSKSGKNEGWLKLFQSYHNNTVEWWIDKCKTAYQNIYVIDSSWNDEISYGKWFICRKSQ